MLFGMTNFYEPKDENGSGTSWSLKDLRHMVPELSDGEVYSNQPYLEEGAWFGRTQAVAKLLGASGGVPLVSPATLYLTGLLASAAGLHKSPDLFNAWWRIDEKVKPEEIGVVLGWLNTTLEPPRAHVWKLLKAHHNNRSETEQAIKRDVEINLTISASKRPLNLIKYTGGRPFNAKNKSEKKHRKKNHRNKKHPKNKFRNKKKLTTKLPLTRSSVIIPREIIPTDRILKQAYLKHKQQLQIMIRSTSVGATKKIKSTKSKNVKMNKPKTT